MATSLTCNGITVRMPWAFNNVLDWSDASNSSSYSWTKNLANGTGANQADKIYVVQTTLAASTAVNYDLAGSLVDMYGVTITFARIKVIYVELQTTTAASSILLGGHATVAMSNWITATPDLDTAQPKVRIRNGGVFFLAAPDATAYAVTATTEDMLTITNADGAVTATYRMVLVGASA